MLVLAVVLASPPACQSSRRPLTLAPRIVSDAVGDALGDTSAGGEGAVAPPWLDLTSVELAVTADRLTVTWRLAGTPEAPPRGYAYDWYLNLFDRKGRGLRTLYVAWADGHLTSGGGMTGFQGIEDLSADKPVISGRTVTLTASVRRWRWKGESLRWESWTSGHIEVNANVASDKIPVSHYP